MNSGVDLKYIQIIRYAPWKGTIDLREGVNDITNLVEIAPYESINERPVPVKADVTKNNENLCQK